MDYRATAGAGAAIVTSWVRSLVKMKWLHYTGGGATRMKPLKCREFPTFFRGVTRQQVIFKTFLTLCHASIICLRVNDALTRKRESWRRCTALLLTHIPPSPTPHLSIPLSHIHYQLPPSPFILHSPRVDSFVFFFVSRNTILYETGHCFAKIRSFCETVKYPKIRKKVFRVVSRNCKTMFHFVFSYIFFQILYLLFEFRTLYSSFVPLVEFCTFYSSFVPIIQVVYLFAGINVPSRH